MTQKQNLDWVWSSTQPKFTDHYLSFPISEIIGLGTDIKKFSGQYYFDLSGCWVFTKKSEPISTWLIMQGIEPVTTATGSISLEYMEQVLKSC